jgi:Holliday junction resolvasome RuvABC endonuclease subunit
MKIIGFDCSTRLIAGFIIDAEEYSTILLAGKASDDTPTRINAMFLLAVHFLKKSKPDYVYIENAAYLQNVKTSFLIHSVVDAVRFACVLNDIPCQTVEITSWKKDVLGNGRAEKSDIMQFAIVKYGDKLITNQDLADSAGVATYGYKRMKA